jgi:hypothetical protein
MANERRPADWRWITAGVIVMVLAGWMLYHYQAQGSRVARLADQHRRLDLVARMSRDLARAAEAEKNAVMAATDEESQTFAAEARAGTAAVNAERDELAALLPTSGGGDEKELLARFSVALAEYEQLDRELLDLAVRNTNLKAYALAFGPAAQAVGDLDDALSRLLARMADSSSPHAQRVMLMAADARSGTLRTQALLPAHIAADNAAHMDSLEAGFTAEDRRVRANLEHLAVLVPPAGKADLAAATAACDRFDEVKGRILELSRQNTNVRSLALSLNQKRLVTVKCQDALAALEQSVRREPVPGAPANPR